MILLVLIIILALVFDFINGFHDAANSIATIVSTKVLKPFQAVLWAASFNFLAFFIFTDHNVSNTIAKSVETDFITLPVLFCGLLAAIAWNLLTWWYGIPSSSSHTLIGGFIGAAIGNAGFNFSVIVEENVYKTLAFIVLAPLMGMIISIFITLVTIQKNLLHRLFFIFLATGLMLYFAPFKPTVRYILLGMIAIFVIVYIVDALRPESASRKNTMFKGLQLVSSAAFSLGHGGNDAQKVMGIISVAIAYYYKDIYADHKVVLEQLNWIPLACYTAIGLGTMSGGWKIVKTMGSKITKVTPLEGVCAETAGAITLYFTEAMKIPVSTTHTITGSIIGVGLTKRVSAVRWGMTINIIWAWVLTIPVSAALAMILVNIYKLILPS